MAIIYGRADSEKQLLDLYPKRVKEIDDIDKVEVRCRKSSRQKPKGCSKVSKMEIKKTIQEI